MFYIDISKENIIEIFKSMSYGLSIKSISSHFNLDEYIVEGILVNGTDIDIDVGDKFEIDDHIIIHLT